MSMTSVVEVCPSHSFAFVMSKAGRRKKNPLASDIMAILGSRIDCMSYPEDGYCWVNRIDSIVDAMVCGDSGILGMQIADYLSFLIPCPEIYPKVIVIRDVVSPFQVAKQACLSEDGKRRFSFGEDEDSGRPIMVDLSEGVRLFCDERYFLSIKDGDRTISIRICKIQK